VAGKRRGIVKLNRSQVQTLALLHTLLGGFVLLAEYSIQHPIAEVVFISIALVYLEIKIWQVVKMLGPVQPKLIGKW
jgi:hypothetical protein